MTPLDRARQYLAKIPGAVSGNKGHSQTFSVACALVNGFALPETDAWTLLTDYSRTCSPPWSERELRHKLDSAMKAHHDKPRGHLLTNGSTRYRPPAPSQHTPQPAPACPTPKSAQPRYDLDGTLELPEPIEDGARKLIRTLFQPGEGIRIAPGRMKEDEDSDQPDGGGTSLSREEWLTRLDKCDGNPNGIFSSTRKTGIYIGVNPYRIGCTKDADVTDYRHALVEFDKGITPEQQFQLYQLSNLPCAAIIDSGRRSIHAWVKVEARDRREYDERVKALYDHFAACDLVCDGQNKNPGRFSRLPNCIRFDRRQELLALNTGAESFTEWLAHVQADGIGTTTSFKDVFDYDPASDNQTILGNRWLCRGGSCTLVGPSGVGKSSLALQMAICWALGRPALGIKPAHPLKVLVVQAENDPGDVHEMVSGVCEGLQVSFEADALTMLERNMVFNRNMSHTGFEFTQALQRLIDRHKPDLVVLDPLLSFIGADISRQEVCSQFLRNWLNPIAEATGVAWLMVHHTGKSSTDPKAKSHWKTSDYSYSGIGSSELTNWTRAMAVLEEISAGKFKLRFAKRGDRAGTIHPNGDPATVLWVNHSTKGIFWEQTDPPEQPAGEPEHKGGKPSKQDEVIAMNLHSFISGCTKEGEGKNVIAKRLEAWLAEKGEDISLPTCKRLIERLASKPCNMLKKTAESLYVRGSNA